MWDSVYTKFQFYYSRVSFPIKIDQNYLKNKMLSTKWPNSWREARWRELSYDFSKIKAGVTFLMLAPLKGALFMTFYFNFYFKAKRVGR